MDLDAFKPNDRNALANNIQALHAVAATLTKQPILLLNPNEVRALTDSVAGVLDYHKINVTSGAIGPFGLYLTLMGTVFAVYMPRLAALKAIKQQQIDAHATQASTPEEEAVTRNAGTVDFSGDISPAGGAPGTTH